LEQLRSLKILWLHGNQFTGCVPPALAPICQCPDLPLCA